jgi:hypothetical protein
VADIQAHPQDIHYEFMIERGCVMGGRTAMSGEALEEEQL